MCSDIILRILTSTVKKVLAEKGSCDTRSMKFCLQNIIAMDVCFSVP